MVSIKRVHFPNQLHLFLIRIHDEDVTDEILVRMQIWDRDFSDFGLFDMCSI